MFPYKLENPPVSRDLHNMTFEHTADISVNSFAPFLYTPEGKKLIDQLWQETMEELKFANTRTVLSGKEK